MIAISDIPLFLDERFIDELWIRITREGLTQEKVEEVSKKVTAKISMSGIGHLWSLVVPNLGGSLEGEGARKGTEKTTINSLLRAILLPELMPGLVDVSYSNSFNPFGSLSQGDFARILCNNIALTPIPTFASYMRQVAYSSIRSDVGVDPEVKLDEILKTIDSSFNSTRATTFFMRTDGDDHSGAKSLQLLMESETNEIYNALSVSNDDLYLIAALIEVQNNKTVLFSILEEQFVKRNLAAFIGNRPVSFFGQIAYLKPASASLSDGTNFVGIRSAVVSLC